MCIRDRFNPVIAVQRILRLVPGEPPLVGHFIAGIGLEYLGHLVRKMCIRDRLPHLPFILMDFTGYVKRKTLKLTEAPARIPY